jgi:hypothetical protein
MSVESPIPQSRASQSELIPAFMLAVLVAVTGLETAMVMATPHRAAAHAIAPTLQMAQLYARH